MLISLNSCPDLTVKNNSIVTGYENFYLEKDNVKLYPTKDFDFIDKNVVCQKCFQQFASRLSYIDHVGTDICVKTCDGPNPVYLKSKKRRTCRQVRKKNKKSLIAVVPRAIDQSEKETHLLRQVINAIKCMCSSLLKGAGSKR